VIALDRVTCVLFARNGLVSCFGDGEQGVLGKGTKNTIFPLSLSSPIVFDQQTVAVMQISGVYAHACALFTNGRTRCWGRNWFGELGQGHSRTPVGTSASDMTSIRFISFADSSATVGQISAGGAHTCALFSNPAGRIICWGRGDSGQIATGSTLDKGLSPSDLTSLSFIPFAGSDLATSVSAGGHHTCAVFSFRSVRCWGNNEQGQLGWENTRNVGEALQSILSLGFIVFSDTSPVMQVSAGEFHTCAIVGRGRVRCWGSGARGALGSDSSVNLGDTSKSMQTLPYVVGPVYADPIVALTTGGAVITLTGATMAADSPVRFSSSLCPSLVLQSLVNSPLFDVSRVATPAWPCGPGPANITVSSTATVAPIVFVSPSASLTSISPTGWTVGDAVTLTVTGSNLTFTPVARCRFGLNSSSSLTVTSPTTGVCQSPLSPFSGDGLRVSFSLDGYKFVDTNLRVVILCRSDQYTDSEGRCASCPENTYAVGGSGLQSCTCKPGFFNRDLRPGAACVECPRGASCDGGTKEPRPVFGFWSSASDPFTIFRCVPERACSGGVDECGTGFQGRICTTCTPGYFRSSNDCIRCPSGSKGIAVAVALLVVAVAVLFLVLRGVRRSKAAGGTLSIATKFFQVLMVVGRLNVSWPKRVRDTIDGVTSPLTFKLDSVGLECSDVKIDYEVKWALTMLLPVFFALAFVLAYALLRAWTALRRRPFPASLKDQAINAYLSVLSLGFLTLASTALEPFACLEKEDGSWMMVANPGRVCHDGRWWRLAGWAVIAVLLYVVAIPIGLLWFLRKNRSRLGEDLKFGDRFSGLYANYVPSLAHVWEPVVMLEKVAIACVGLFLAGFAMLQALLLLLLLVVSLSLYQTYTPYSRGNDNRLHSVLRWCSIVVLGAGMLFCADKFPSDRSRYAFEWLAVLVIVGSTLMVAAALALNLWAVRNSLKAGLSKELQACLALFTRFGRAEVAEWLMQGTESLRDRMQHVLEALDAVGGDSSSSSSGSSGGGALMMVELAPTSIMTVVEDTQADRIVATFTRNVFRAEVVPFVRTWLAATPDKELVDHFIECFAAFGQSKQPPRRQEEESSPPAAAASHQLMPLIERLYGPALAHAAKESKDKETGGACIDNERWREAFHALWLA
jgi:hypothetical protein